MHQNTDPSRSEDRLAPSAGQKAQTQSAEREGLSGAHPAGAGPRLPAFGRCFLQPSPPLPRRARVAPSCSHAHSQAQSPPHVPVPMARSASDRPAQARQCAEGRQWARHARCRRRRSRRLSAGTGVCTAALAISALRRSGGSSPSAPPSRPAPPTVTVTCVLRPRAPPGPLLSARGPLVW